jgi:hypothetical protein
MTRTAMTAALLLAMTTMASAQTASIPVPAAPTARDVPGAKELPDKTLTYKILFDAEKGARTNRTTSIRCC